MNHRLLLISYALASYFPATIACAEAPKEWAAFFEKANCIECHDADSRKGGLDLTSFAWNPSDAASLQKWTKLHDRVARGEMPPKAEDRLPAADLQPFLNSLEKSVFEHQSQEQQKNGRTPLRRLNRTEYEYTVQELLGIRTPLKRLLPEETPTGGFETVAEGQRFSTLQMEKWLEAANAALDGLFTGRADSPKGLREFTLIGEKSIAENLAKPHTIVKKEDLQGTIDEKEKAKERDHRVSFREIPAQDGKPAAVAFFNDTWQLGLGHTKLQTSGTFLLRIKGYTVQTEQPVTLALYAGNYKENRHLGTWVFRKDMREVVSEQFLEEGEFLKLVPQDLHQPSGMNLWEMGAHVYPGPGLAISGLSLEGPMEADAIPAGLRKLCEPEITVATHPQPIKQRPWVNGKRTDFELKPAGDAAEALRKVLERFTATVLRRPAEPADSAPAIAVALAELAAGSPLEEALRVGMSTILSSGPFLLFHEAPGALDAWALANRLSYTLWSTGPDAALRAAAADGSLLKIESLLAQANRMLADPRAERFFTQFPTQWLGLAALTATAPDKKLYPEFDESLQESLAGEPISFFREVLTKNLPVTSFADSDFIMVNRRLGQHYQLEQKLLEGLDERFQRVAISPETRRGGLLGQAAIAKITANGTVTSPVVRGTWVLKKLLGQPPFPPPPVPAIEPDTRGATTVRELLDKHRTSTTCNSCHQRLDPPGFAMEEYDVIGGLRTAYRSLENGKAPTYKLNGNNIWQYKLAQPVDATGKLPDGQTFQGIRDFKQLLLKEKQTLVEALAGKLVSYSTGAQPSFADRRQLKAIAEATEQKGGGLRTLLQEVFRSELFRNR